ncbi:hypothetical protein NliqN6_1433 [Naganishia liquefaciens]|uniref:Uncharacterized protein n=1 Tax=Naganishia liquefaciens TaxID=104408 RepID=A0A8H3YES8_9TREE|nr:hypothetical protein NliqN6_1433 [Naganishia liquefaciens]
MSVHVRHIQLEGSSRQNKRGDDVQDRHIGRTIDEIDESVLREIVDVDGSFKVIVVVIDDGDIGECSFVVDCGCRRVPNGAEAGDKQPKCEEPHGDCCPHSMATMFVVVQICYRVGGSENSEMLTAELSDKFRHDGMIQRKDGSNVDSTSQREAGSACVRERVGSGSGISGKASLMEGELSRADSRSGRKCT